MKNELLTDVQALRWRTLEHITEAEHAEDLVTLLSGMEKH